MLNKETLITLFEGNFQGLVFNLGLLPADKLDWKPAPQAKSALEIANHLAGFTNEVCNALQGKKQAFTPAASGDEAERILSESGFTLAHNVASKAEVEAVLATAQRAGAQILKPAQDAFWGGYHGFFADPDGFVWEIAWNPHLDLEQGKHEKPLLEDI